MYKTQLVFQKLMKLKHLVSCCNAKNERYNFDILVQICSLFYF